jgi:hypothetical protein
MVDLDNSKATQSGIKKHLRMKLKKKMMRLIEKKTSPPNSLSSQGLKLKYMKVVLT